nr:hypothetical protein [Tanacetum cinerariifolium]
MIDYALWKVIKNGATLKKTQVMEGVMTEMPITAVKEKAQRRLELELLEEKLSQEDVNQKLLRRLSLEWNTHVVVWRNKADLDTMSMDDLYNNLKLYEPEVKGMSSSSSSTQNMAFVSSSNNNTSSTNRVVSIAQAVNTAHRVSTASTQVNVAYSTNIDNLSDAVICSFFSSQLNSPQLVYEDLEQSHSDDIEEMDLRWKMAMLTMRATRFLKKIRRKLTINGHKTIGFDKDVPVETSTSIALVSCDGLGGYDWSDQVEEGPNYTLMAFLSLGSDTKIVDNCKKGLGYENYNAVPPPYTGNFMPPTPDLSFIGLEEFINKHVVENRKAKSSEKEPNVVKKNDDALIIEEWVSDKKEEDVKPKRKDTQVPQPSVPTKSVVDEAVHKELGDSLVRAATTASSLKAKQDSGNITKTQSKETPNKSSSQRTNSGGGIWCQETIGDTTAQTRFESVSKHSNDSLLVRGNILRSDRDIIKLNDLMELCTNLQNKVLELEKIKSSQRNEIDSLKRRVKKLEKRNKSRTHRLKRLYKVSLIFRVETSREEECLGKDASKQGRINVIDADEDITLVNDANNEMFDVDDLGGEEVFFAEQEVVSIAATTETKTTEEITFAQALEALKTSKPKAKGIVFQKLGKTTIFSQQSQDKGKGIMIEEHVKPKKKDQIRLDKEAA